jgi:tricorn protease
MSSNPFLLTRSVYVVVLKKTDPSPLAPESDEEKIAEDKKPERRRVTNLLTASRKGIRPQPAASPEGGRQKSAAASYCRF